MADPAFNGCGAIGSGLTQAGRVVVHLPAKSVRSCLVGIELQCLRAMLKSFGEFSLPGLLLRLAAKILRHLHAVGRITRFREKEIISAPVDRLKLGRINPPVDHPTGEAVAVLE